MKEHTHQFFKETYADALLQVVGHYSAELPRASFEKPVGVENQSASIISFGSDSIHGFSALFAVDSATQLLSRSPINDPLDWLGELNNQVVGRLRNSLARRGIVAQMGVPITTTVGLLDFGVVAFEPTSWRIDWSCGTMNGVLVIEAADDIDCDCTEQLTVAAEGSVTMF